MTECSPSPRVISIGRWIEAPKRPEYRASESTIFVTARFRFLIDMGFSATAIADRVGHESIDITYNYAHLFPSKQTEMADKLNMERGN